MVKHLLPDLQFLQLYHYGRYLEILTIVPAFSCCF